MDRGITPTDEQRKALAHFRTGKSFGIEAGAGTGKTSTLLVLADAEKRRRGQYVAFNRAIVAEAKGKLPEHVAANTAHSLAFRQEGRKYKHRLDGPRMRSAELARRLRTEPMWFTLDGGVRKGLQPEYLASLVMRSITRFCQTADPNPTGEHVPYINGIDLPLDDGRRTFGNNDAVRAALAPVIARAWADICDPQGQLRFSHEHYLKLWQLNDPRIPADFILFDEAQDASPVMLDAVRQQRNAQLVFVGDSQQQIYEFTGAVNALADLPVDARTFLTQSFRFGPAIADAANLCLTALGADLRLRGLESLDGEVGDLDEYDAILTRTNATAIRHVLTAAAVGRPVHLVGDGSDVLSFARAADELQRQGYTMHPELTCFDSWSEVQAYVANDPQGSELRLLVSLVDEFGYATIEQALGRTVPEGPGVLVVSTAHKAKGREWDRVKLGDDLAQPGEDGSRLSDGELRLLYVAVTRAKRLLDPGAALDAVRAPVAAPTAV